MKIKRFLRKNFLVCYTICVVLFYAAAYLFIAPAIDGKSESNAVGSASPNSITTPFLAAWNPDSAPENGAEAAVVIDAKSGAVVYEKNRDARLPMASTTKIMTAKIILDMLPLDMKVTVPKEATLIEGSSIYLTENEQISVETLLYGLLLESGNDAAEALAVACSGSSEEFAKLMNDKASEMGLNNTSFANPHGLTAENHFTTAYELAYITMCAMKNDKFREIVSTQKYITPAADGNLTRFFFNHNKLLRTYDGSVGVKTGYTEAAGRCLVSAAEKDGEMYICVTLDDRSDWADHTALLDYAFASFDSIEIAPENGFAIYSHGKRLANNDAVYLTVSQGEKPEISYDITAEKDFATVNYRISNNNLGSFSLSAPR